MKRKGNQSLKLRETIHGTKVRIIETLMDGHYLAEAITKSGGVFVTQVSEKGLKDEKN